ncbi:23S rRNA pseudouridine(2605) synthase RluB [soil metagenome]
MIADGRVEVDGKIVVEPGIKVTPDQEVRVDGGIITVSRHYTVILNKPLGVVTTLRDPHNRPTVMAHLPDYGVVLKPVGRLDMDTEGLILCTNDGELAHRLSHPRYGVEKEYEAIVTGIVEERALTLLRKGVYIEGGRTGPAKVEIIHAEPRTNTTGLRITIHEGRNRQVRLMCEAVGHTVQKLRRTRYAFLRVKGMRTGEARLLGKQELDKLREMVGMPKD